MKGPFLVLCTILGCGFRSREPIPRSGSDGDVDSDADADGGADADSDAEDPDAGESRPDASPTAERCEGGIEYPPAGSAPYDIGEILDDQTFEGSFADGTIAFSDYFCEHPTSLALTVIHFDAQITADDGMGMIDVFDRHRDDGLRQLVVASWLPDGTQLDRKNAELYFAGVEFDWAIDPGGWGRSWGDGRPLATMVVRLDDMSIRAIIPDWNEETLTAEVVAVLEGD